MNALLVLPIATPLATAAVAFLLRSRPTAVRAVSVGGALALCLAAVALLTEVLQTGVLAGQAGAWPAPFGVTLVADHLSALMVAITGVTGLAVAVYDLADASAERTRLGHHAVYHVLLAGIAGAFLTGDVFNLYVWFEVMLIASFGLLTLGGGPRQIDGAVKYVAVNVVATVTFLAGIGLLYGLTGTLNLAELHLRVAALDEPGLLGAVAVLFLVAFGIKAAAFPLYAWLPASYHTPPVGVSAIFSGLLTKVGVYALIRMFTLVFPVGTGGTQTALLVVAAFTMLAGVLGAASERETRRVLSFHIVSQIGYILLGLALFTPLGIAAAVFYLVHHILVKANLFLVSGVTRRVGGSFALDELGGLYRSRPWLAVLFLVPAFSLAGFPPLSGFWAKLLVIRASLDVEAWLLAAVALAVGLFTIFSMLKLWVETFWKPRPEGTDAPPPDDPPNRRELVLRAAPIAALAALTVAIGLWSDPLLRVATRAATELLDPSNYVAVVLGGSP